MAVQLGVVRAWQAPIRLSLAQEPPAVILALAGAVSVYFYVRIIYLMYMQEPAGEPVVGLRAAWPQVALVASAVFALLLGLFPDFFVTVAGASVGFLPL